MAGSTSTHFFLNSFVPSPYFPFIGSYLFYRFLWQGPLLCIGFLRPFAPSLYFPFLCSYVFNGRVHFYALFFFYFFTFSGHSVVSRYHAMVSRCNLISVSLDGFSVYTLMVCRINLLFSSYNFDGFSVQFDSCYLRPCDLACVPLVPNVDIKVSLEPQCRLVR